MSASYCKCEDPSGNIKWEGRRPSYVGAYVVLKRELCWDYPGAIYDPDLWDGAKRMLPILLKTDQIQSTVKFSNVFSAKVLPRGLVPVG